MTPSQVVDELASWGVAVAWSREFSCYVDSVSQISDPARSAAGPSALGTRFQVDENQEMENLRAHMN